MNAHETYLHWLSSPAISEEERAELEAFINEKYPDDEIYFINGGQDIYPFIFVAE